MIDRSPCSTLSFILNYTIGIIRSFVGHRESLFSQNSSPNSKMKRETLGHSPHKYAIL